MTTDGSFEPHRPGNCVDCAARHGDQAISADDILIDQQRAEIARLKTDLDEAHRAGWGQVIADSWGMGSFVGPCVHGRDPYTRCEDGCEGLTPREAFAAVAIDAAAKAVKP